jgi:drug/metabolite transporter (DMT)-like permease
MMAVPAAWQALAGTRHHHAAMGSVVAGVALACLASVLFNAAIVIQASEVREVPREHALQISLIGRLVRRPRWLLGSALGLTAFPLQTAALLWAPLTAVQPADAAGLLVLLFLGARMLHERVGRVEVAAVAAIVIGIVVLTLAAPKRQVTQVEGAHVLLPMVAVALVALAPVVFRRRIGPDSITVVIGAGFAFALGAFCAKIVADAISRHAWGILLVGLAVAGLAAFVGTLTEQTALQRRPATQVAPIIFAVELLVPVLLAVLVVGEDWQHTSVVGIVAALALVIGGAFTLGRAPTVARLLEAGSSEPAARQP